MNKRRGFTLIELLTVMAIIALLVGLLLPALAAARAKAQLTKDQTQIKQIHAAWATFARDYDGIFPTPGLINRLAIVAPGSPVLDGTHRPGRGPEDLKTNNSAHMLSACIMQNYFTPELTVGPTEPSGYVAVKDDYNWALYDPTADVYWDSDPLGGVVGNNGAYIPYSVDLGYQEYSGTYARGVSNLSYAHTPIAGERKVNQWRDSLDSRWAVLANRGVICGDDAPNSQAYKESITLELHGGDKEWLGNVCYNDNHVDLLHTFWPEGVNFVNDEGDVAPDNIFSNDDQEDCESGLGSDAWLAITIEITDEESWDIATEWD